jgi:undecaprenyl-diphosphatase
VNAIDAAILGFLQGATEFLPVSSSGHLVMGQEVLNIVVDGIAFEVLLHVATLLSVLIVYRERLLDLVRGVVIGRDAKAWRYVGLLILATLPAAVVGLAFEDTVDVLFASPFVVGCGLLFTGTVLFSTRWVLKRDLSSELDVRSALLIGLAQCIAIVPGVSRSGSTVVTALWLGISPLEAAAFSFLMSIPTIAGAAVLKLPELSGGLEGVSGGALAIGFLVAGVTGVLAIRLLVKLLPDRSFANSAWSGWGVGALFLAWLSIGR